MAFVDEKIALLEKAHRKATRNEEQSLEQTQNEKTKEPVVTLQDIREGIKSNQMFLKDEELTFEVMYYFKNKFPIILVKDFFDEVQKEEQVLLLTSNRRGLCMMFTYLSESLPQKTLTDRKEEMQDNFIKMEMYAEVIKEETLKNLDYLCYKTPTSKGWVYNIIFWIKKGERKVVGNFNCLQEDQKTYGLLLEALVMEIDEMI